LYQFWCILTAHFLIVEIHDEVVLDNDEVAAVLFKDLHVVLVDNEERTVRGGGVRRVNAHDDVKPWVLPRVNRLVSEVRALVLHLDLKHISIYDVALAILRVDARDLEYLNEFDVVAVARESLRDALGELRERCTACQK